MRKSEIFQREHFDAQVLLLNIILKNLLEENIFTSIKKIISAVTQPISFFKDCQSKNLKNFENSYLKNEKIKNLNQ